MAHRPSRHARGYGSKWAKASREYLHAHPLCVLCGRKAECVDHITPHNRDPKLFWSRSNWQALCWSCHNAKTRQDETRKPMSGCDERGWPLSRQHIWHDESRR